MSATVEERVELEVEAPAEEVYDHLVKLDTFCEFIRSAEKARRVDLSESHWSFKGPAGRATRFDPESFGGCLRKRHLTLAAGEGGASEPDFVVGGGTFDFKALSSTRTLLVFTAHFAAPDTARRPPSFDLDAIVTHLLPVSMHRWHRDRANNLVERIVVRYRENEGSERDRTSEDRSWLEGDLSRLGEWEPYDWAEGELEAARPVRYVPGVGLVVEDEEGATGGEPDRDLRGA